MQTANNACPTRERLVLPRFVRIPDAFRTVQPNRRIKHRARKPCVALDRNGRGRIITTRRQLAIGVKGLFLSRRKTNKRIHRVLRAGGLFRGNVHDAGTHIPVLRGEPARLHLYFFKRRITDARQRVIVATRTHLQSVHDKSNLVHSAATYHQSRLNACLQVQHFRNTRYGQVLKILGAQIRHV